MKRNRLAGTAPAVAPALSAVALASAVAVSLLAGAAGPALGSDVIGIYTGGDAGSTNTFEGTGATSVYLVFSDLSGSGIAGWETRVDVDGSGAMFLGATLLGQGPINLFAPPVFQVGLGVPMTVPGPNSSFVVASLNFQVLTTDDTYLFTTAIPITSWPDDPGPGYADAADVDRLVRCTPASTSQTFPVFGFNGVPYGPRPESSTWGGVKGLYER